MALRHWLKALHPDLQVIARERNTVGLERAFETSKSTPIDTPSAKRPQLLQQDHTF